MCSIVATGEFISAAPIAPVSWTRGLDPKTGRPDVHPDALTPTERGVTVSPLQSHNTSQMAFNPATRLVYVPIASGGGFSFTGTNHFELTPGQQVWGLRGRGDTGPPPPIVVPPSHGPDLQSPIQSRGILSAWDPATQTERWFTIGGGQSGGGVFSTASNLVVQVTPQGRMFVYTADKGEKLLEIASGQTSGMSPPMTYMLDGKQVHRVHGRPRRHRRRVQSSTTAARRANRPRGCATATTAACADHNAGDAEVVRVHDRCEPLALVKSRAIT